MNKFKEQFEYIRKQQTILDTRILNGNKYHESRIGSWDLMTFDNTELKYNGDINEKPKSFIKRLFKRK